MATGVEPKTLQSWSDHVNLWIMITQKSYKFNSSHQMSGQSQLEKVEGHVDVVPTKRKLKQKQTFELNQNF